ncbi:MAG: hypothetical protein WCG00_18420 [Hyphomicrobiales bacterium]
MLTINLVLDYLRVGYPALATGALDPTSTLYGTLAGTYGSAAYAAATNDHKSLCRCYILSAALHGLMHSFGG